VSVVEAAGIEPAQGSRRACARRDSWQAPSNFLSSRPARSSERTVAQRSVILLDTGSADAETPQTVANHLHSGLVLELER
jgi:hypothetical protein